MRLTSGARLGPYEVVSGLGAGGMGEVYRARDVRLGREVAIKVLASDSLVNPNEQERFEREARILSNLSHPHICALYDVGATAEGLTYLVMERLDGEALAARLTRGPLPIAAALRHAIEIAEALAAAHGAGVTHRDLKPGNIVLTRTGAKLLDFGLAKQSPGPGVDTEALTASPDLTVLGAVVGTPQYMAPEQIVGAPVDRRTDIWALGVVIFEMVTGRHPFDAGTTAARFAAVLERDPPPLAAPGGGVPPALEQIVHRCLARDPDERWQDVRDLAVMLRWLAAPRTESAAGGRSHARRAVTWAAAAALGAFLLGALLGSLRQGADAPGNDAERWISFVLDAPAGGEFGLATMQPNPAVSPDGRRLAFVAAANAGQMLWLQDIGALDARPLGGTQNAAFPFWSPDGRFVGFGAQGALLRISADGTGAPQHVVEIDGPYFGGTWSSNGTIVFAVDDMIHRVPASGGEAQPLTSLDPESGEYSHRFPVMLPDGTRFLYLVLSDRKEHEGLYLASLDDPALKRRVLQTDANGAFALGPDGTMYLLFVRDFTLLAQPFDVERAELTDAPIIVTRPIAPGEMGRFAPFATGDRTLVHRPRFRPNSRLVWIDRRGIPLETLGNVNERYSYPALSKDGAKVAVSYLDKRTERDNIVWFDLRRGVSELLTSEPVAALMPQWSADGSRVIFSSAREGPWNLYSRAIAGGSEDALFAAAMPRQKYDADVTADGQLLVFQGDGDLWLLSLDGERQAYRLTETPFDERHPRISPDGRWLAYASDETGEWEVFLTSFPSPAGRARISTAGGADPHWRGDGRELYYVTPDLMLMAVPIEVADTPVPRTPQPLFRAAFDRQSLAFGSAYAPAADGERFIIAEATESQEPQLIVQIGWRPAQR